MKEYLFRKPAAKPLDFSRGKRRGFQDQGTAKFIRRFLAIIFIWLSLIVSSFAFSFVVFGDNHGENKIFYKLIDQVNNEKGITLAFNNGDMVVYGKDHEYRAYIAMIAKLKVPVYHAMGNHDAVQGGWKNFEKYFGVPYRSFDRENCHFIILDNSFKQSFDRRQFEWLKKDLAASRARHKFVFMHRPTFDPSEIYQDYVMSGREVAEELMRLFIRYRVDYVFAGHIHGYARAERDGVVYIVTGGAGAPLYLPNGFGGVYHYVRVDVDGDKVSDKMVKISE